MSQPNSHNADEERLHAHLSQAQLLGRPINHKTARELARWFDGAHGRGFRVFIDTGAVTGSLYSELARLYDQRQPEAERWLDNLTRFVMAQPIMPMRRQPRRGDDEANQ